MFAYLVKRLFYVATTVAVMSVLIFWITQVMPGNVAYMILGDFAAPEDIATLEAQLGLNDPAHVQYLRWAGGMLRGDMGMSLSMNQPVSAVLWGAVGRSAILAGISIVLVAALGIWLGVYGGVRRGRLADRIISIGTYINIAIPEFFWAIVVIMLFAGYLNWFPATGYQGIEHGLWAWARHLVLPVFTLVFGLIAHVSRLTRSSVIDVMQSQYIRAARARGLTERRIVREHALRNALLPTVTVLAIDVGVLMGGVVVAETIFSYPGLGRTLIYAIQQMDMPLLQACMMVVTCIYALSNLAADVTYALLNPRIRYGNAADA
jgi:ABC-type dipeptide/oligopeptide/nickel transport systems, permease components